MKFKLFFYFLFCFPLISWAQEIEVSGTVTDGNMPLPGVNIIVKGTSNGTITDFDGNYNLSDVPSDAVLTFSFLGFTKQEINVGGKTKIDIILEEDAAALSEVVVTGYSSQREVGS